MLALKAVQSLKPLLCAMLEWVLQSSAVVLAGVCVCTKIGHKLACLIITTVIHLILH